MNNSVLPHLSLQHQHELQSENTMNYIGVVWRCSSLKITSMLPVLLIQLEPSFDEVRRAFYSEETRISAHICHLDDSDSLWEHQLKAWNANVEQNLSLQNGMYPFGVGRMNN